MPRKNIASVPILPLLSIMQDRDANRARDSYLRIVEWDDLGDQAVHDYLEDIICNAIMLDDTVVELTPEVAQVVLLMVKAGIRKKRGGQPSSRNRSLQKRTLASIGRQIKGELIEKGESAIQAHLEASEQAAAMGQARGIEYDASTIAREMENAS